MDKLAIISVDGHVTGSRPQYRHYVERQHVDAYDEWVKAVDSIPFDIGNLKPEFRPDAQWDSDRRSKDLESVGVIAEVLFSNGLPFQHIPSVMAGSANSPEITRESTRIYNRWLADFCAATPGRRAGQAVVSFDDVGQAVKDIRWAKEHGLSGIMMPALTDGARFFFDPELDPVWAACQEMEMVISQHGGTGAPSYAPQGYAAIMTLALEHSFFSGRSLWQMIYGGVFDRFPELKVVFVETETDWVGRIIQKMDRRLSMGDDWLGFVKFLNLERPFSELATDYWANNCYAGLSPFNTTSEASIEEIIGEPGTKEDGTFCFGTNRSMFGVDYPHFESIFPGTLDAVRQLVGDSRVSQDDARKVLYGNAARVYGFDLDRLKPQFDGAGFTLEDLNLASASI